MSVVQCGINVETLAHHITTRVNENTLGITVDQLDVQAALPAFTDVVLACAQRKMGWRHGS
jgi:hypothetical protein